MYRLASDTNNNTNKKRVSKKGIILTALIVAAIIGASFIVYLIPQLYEVSDKNQIIVLWLQLNCPDWSNEHYCLQINSAHLF